MPFKSIIREFKELRDGISSISGRKLERKHVLRRGRSHIAPETSVDETSAVETSVAPPFSGPVVELEENRWADLTPELLLCIIRRVEASQVSWPARRDVVACASVCRSWRRVTKEAVRTPERCGLLTFPISLKQPGPRDFPIQCFIRRDRANSTFLLYLGLSPALSAERSKLLLAARKIRKATGTDFVISLVPHDFSRAQSTCVGKLRSNFLGTKFSIYDRQFPSDAAVQSNHMLHKRTNWKQMAPRVPFGNCSVATISYELNVLRTKGPRRMQCNMQSIPSSAIEEGGIAPTPTEFPKIPDEPLASSSNGMKKIYHGSSSSSNEPSLVLKNKAPRWHEQLQCWCLNFKGRVTVASVKNFQLVAAAEPDQNVPNPSVEQDNVILQFGKIGKDTFTMDYRYPLSTFQAFAISLSSFGAKPACE